MGRSLDCTPPHQLAEQKGLGSLGGTGCQEQRVRLLPGFAWREAEEGRHQQTGALVKGPLMH